jgi:parvulin-like peptidyl-prolyl isomerase
MLKVLSPLLREPLTYFLLAGGGLFALWGWFQNDTDEYRIEVTAEERARIEAQWQAQMSRKPSADEMSSLIEQFVREEIYYREALRMGLDRNDTIIRRRLAQKLTFLTEDIATAAQTNEAELRSFYQQHLERYLQPATYSFQHRYFGAERRSNSEAVAGNAVAALNKGLDPAQTGDSFMLQSAFTGRSEQEIAALFGRDFAQTLTALTPGTWQGPVRSAYGWHAVMLQERSAATQRPYEAVAARVAEDHAQVSRAEANERYYETLKERYQVIEY